MANFVHSDRVSCEDDWRNETLEVGRMNIKIARRLAYFLVPLTALLFLHVPNVAANESGYSIKSMKIVKIGEPTLNANPLAIDDLVVMGVQKSHYISRPVMVELSVQCTPDKKIHAFNTESLQIRNKWGEWVLIRDSLDNSAAGYCSRLNEKKQMDVFNKANEHFERGSRNKEAGKYKDAIADFSNYIKLYPNEAAAYYNRGACYMELNNPVKALADYSTAIEINPQDPDFFVNRGSAHQDLKNFKEAIADYTKAIELADHDAFVYYNRAYCYFRMSNFQAAVTDLTKVIELKPDDADNYLFRAKNYELLDLKKKALDDYRKASELGSKEAQSRLSAMK